MQKVARNEKKCLELQILSKSGRATFGKPYIISIKKTLRKESNQTKTTKKAFVFVLALNRTVLNFVRESRGFFELLVRERLTVSFISF